MTTELRSYRASQRRSRQKIKFCEIFGAVRFSTFATLCQPALALKDFVSFLSGARDGMLHGRRHLYCGRSTQRGGGDVVNSDRKAGRRDRRGNGRPYRRGGDRRLL